MRRMNLKASKYVTCASANVRELLAGLASHQTDA